MSEGGSSISHVAKQYKGWQFAALCTQWQVNCDLAPTSYNHTLLPLSMHVVAYMLSVWIITENGCFGLRTIKIFNILSILEWQPKRWTMTRPECKTSSLKHWQGHLLYKMKRYWVSQTVENVTCGVSCVLRQIPGHNMCCILASCGNWYKVWSWLSIRPDMSNGSWFQLYSFIGVFHKQVKAFIVHSADINRLLKIDTMMPGTTITLEQMKVIPCVNPQSTRYFEWENSNGQRISEVPISLIQLRWCWM